MSEVYRFRSTNRLLDDTSGELEQQTIFFASPEQLNDPMEGFRDIVWHGDSIVWTNLFKHYLYCLHRAYIDVKMFGDDFAFNIDHIPVRGRWDEPPTPQMGDLFSEIWERFCEGHRLSDLIEKIATMRHHVRYNELLFYLDSVHLAALASIKEVHVDHGLSPETERPQGRSQVATSILPASDFFELIPQAEAQVENFSDAMFSIVYQMSVQRRLSSKYNLRNARAGTFESNRQLLLFDFPTIYLEQLGKLLWPQWYTACFAKGYHDSSSWANYGNHHKGVCLIFEASDTEDASSLSLKRVTGSSSGRQGGSRDHWSFAPMTFRDVSYSDKPGEIDFFRNISTLPIKAIMDLWYTDEHGNTSECASHIGPDMDSWQKRHWDDYERDLSIKTRNWEHEQECRLILHGVLEDSLDCHRRTLTYDFESLKGIIFGIRTNDDDKIKIVEVIHKKCLEHGRSDFQFFQAYYSPEHGDIRKHEIKLKFTDVGETGESHTP